MWSKNPQVIEEGCIVLVKEKDDFATEVRSDALTYETMRRNPFAPPLVTPESDLGRILKGKTAAKPDEKYYYLTDSDECSWVQIRDIRR